MLSAVHNPGQPSQSKGAPLAPSSPGLSSPAAAAGRLASASLQAGAPTPRDGLPRSARIFAFPMGPAHRPCASFAEPALPVSGASAGRLRPGPQARPRAPAQGAPAETARCLTLADRLAILAWASVGSGGYARVVLEEGVPGAAPDRGSYVLLYRRRDQWATLGLTRRPAGILVWRCSDGSAHGDYPTMIEALAALPPVDLHS